MPSLDNIENEFTDYEVVEVANTSCDHEYVLDGYNGDLMSLICTKCVHGCQIQKDIKLKNGKIQWPIK